MTCPDFDVVYQHPTKGTRPGFHLDGKFSNLLSHGMWCGCLHFGFWQRVEISLCASEVILSTFSATTLKWRRIDWCFMWCALSYVSACLDPACIFSFSCWALHYKTEKDPRLFTGQACLLKYIISQTFPSICELFACSTLRWDHFYRLQIEGNWLVPY